MCIVSMVTDWGQKTWPTVPQQPFQTAPFTKKQWEEFVELVKSAKKIDEITNQPDCIDPKKEEWLKKMSEYYDEHLK